MRQYLNKIEKHMERVVRKLPMKDFADLKEFVEDGVDVSYLILFNEINKTLNNIKLNFRMFGMKF